MKKRTIPGAWYLMAAVLLLFGGIGAWVQYKAHFEWQDTRDKGIITVAKVLQYEPSEFEPDIALEVYVGDKKYTTTIHDDCDECVGNYYFVKVLKEDPLRYPLLFGEEPVPDCVLKGVKSFDGWKEIPECGKDGDREK